MDDQVHVPVKSWVSEFIRGVLPVSFTEDALQISASRFHTFLGIGMSVLPLVKLQIKYIFSQNIVKIKYDL